MIRAELLIAAPTPADTLRSLDALGPHVRVTVHDPSVLSGLAHGEATGEAPEFGALVDLEFADGAIAREQVPALVAALADDLDRTRSTVIAGEEYVVVPGDEEFMLAMALTRRPDFTVDAFSEYWRTHHAELGRKVPGSEGYRQVHRDDELTQAFREALGFGGVEFDGVALAYYSSIANLESILANEAVTSVLLEDEARFIDHANAAMIVGRS